MDVESIYSFTATSSGSACVVSFSRLGQNVRAMRENIAMAIVEPVSQNSE